MAAVSDLMQLLLSELPLFVDVLLFLTLPFVLGVFLLPQIEAKTKLCAVVAYGLTVGATSSLSASIAFHAAVHVAAFGYFALAGLVVLRLRTPLARGALSRPALFGLCGFLFVMLPALVVPAPASIPIQVAGWELMFSAFSLCVETSSGERPRLSEALFFLIVNPTLVYPEQGYRDGPPRFVLGGLLRSLSGAVVVLAHHVMFALAAYGPLARGSSLTALASFEGYLAFMGYYSARLLAGYAIHSGTASFRIGMLRHFGYVIPERYNYPFMATSPADFWRRWNTYIGGWARRYVFFPLAVRWRRSWVRAPTHLSNAAAVLMSFMVIGLLHDFGLSIRQGTVRSGGLITFTLQAAILLLWSAFSIRRHTLLTAEGKRPSRSRVWLGVRRVALTHVFILSLWFAIPGMSGDGMGVLVDELEGLRAEVVRRGSGP